MLLNSTNLTGLYTGFNASYQGALGEAQPIKDKIATVVPSTTAEEKYGWLGQIPGFREWLGDRVVHRMAAHDYAIKNKAFEMTVGVDRDKIEDDNYGMYKPLFSEMGRASATFGDTLTFDLVKSGFATPCYDGQYFFDTDHPVTDAAGAVQSVSNYGGGAGAAWYLLDVSRALKPFIFQTRRPFEFKRMDAATGEVVFSRKEYVYGVDGRCNVGFGFWQMAYASKQALTHDNYAAARAAMGTFKADGGKPLGIRPTLLLVDPSNEAAGRKIVMNETKAGGESNEWKGTAEVLVAPLLAA